jgi:hypothetical protein
MRPRVNLLLFFASAAALAACSPKRPDCPEGTVENQRPGSLDDKDFAFSAMCVDAFLASRLDATATDPGLDESYATSRAGVMPWTNVLFGEAERACLDAGKQLCVYSLVSSLGCSYQATTEPPKAIARLRPTGVDGIPDDGKHIADWRLLPAWMDSHFISGDVSTASAAVPCPTVNFVAKDAELVAAGIHPAYDPRFKSPLLGFRCCMQRVWSDLAVVYNEPGTLLREGPDPEVTPLLQPEGATP